MNSLENIILRELEIQDLVDYFDLNHPSREFHKFNGPYYKKDTEEELREYVEKLRIAFLKGEKNILKNRNIIADKDTNKMIGQVNWYWKSEETLWMEVGIVIFDNKFWGNGIGYKALKLWIKKIFDENPKLVRIGLSTWSGNKRMMRLAEKLGMKKEAVIRKARIVNNQYYDSISYGILKEEWQGK